MPRLIIVLSGPIRSGKSTLANMMSARFGVTIVKTNQLIASTMRGHPVGRVSLQKQGEKLDRETKGLWVVNELAKVMRERRKPGSYIIDSVRIAEQVNAIRLAFPPVIHVHLTASDVELRRRYKVHAAHDHDRTPYDTAKKNTTEKNVGELAKIADVVIDTERCTDEDVFARATSRMSLHNHNGGYVDVVVGGQFGSEGKGQIVNHLMREYDVIVRVGGPNAGHTVQEADGTSFVYRHIPSGARTHRDVHCVLGPGMVVSVPVLREEITKSEIDYEHLSIDPKVMTISGDDEKSEAELYLRIGSTAKGVGAATARRITERGLPTVVMAEKVPELKHFIRSTHDVLFAALSANQRILVEGTQGTGLSLYHGYYPYVTSRDTTVSGCLSEAGLPPNRVRRVIMVCRTYPIRVKDPTGRGTSGPLSKPIDWGVVSARSGIPREQLEKAEQSSVTHRLRRVGEFDWKLLQLAAFLNGPTDIALTFTDYLAKNNRKAIRFEQLQDETIEFVEEVERVAGAPVSLISNGEGDRHVIDRRNW